MQYLYRHRNELLIIRIICDEPTKSRFSLFSVFFICLVKFSMRLFTLSLSLSLSFYFYSFARSIYLSFAPLPIAAPRLKIPGIGSRSKEDDKEFNQAMSHERHLFYPTINDLSRVPMLNAQVKRRDKHTLKAIHVSC